MKLLFVHQNFPGQFKHLAAAFAALDDVQVVAIGEQANLAGLPPPPRIERLAYSVARAPTQGVHPYLRNVEAAVLRGQAVARKALELRQRGFVPDLICVHAAWGEGLYLRDIFAASRILAYFEYYYRGSGADVGFDPEFPAELDDLLRIRTWNMTQQSSCFAADWGLSPTRWQASTYPAEMQQRLSVIHDGIDTRRLAPDAQARFSLADGRRLGPQDEVVSFVSRGLEPYRGFHVFMRALPELMRRRPAAQFVIVGVDKPSYGRSPADAAHWREKLLAEVGDRLDLGRVHFTGKLPYDAFVRLLQLSRAHVYLTYPFVLSWSMLEAMAVGAPLAASATAPVSEVIEHGRNGLLFDFFDGKALVETVCRLVDDAELRQRLAAAARRTVVERYDLSTVCLPAQASLMRELLHSGRGPAALSAPSGA
ncbi:MAG TPA: glycosyltransferase [Rubrivivax sp.]|nr:glycosyltransferase [Rubrivivax sp.]